MSKKAIVAAALALCAAHSFAQKHTVTFRKMDGTVLSKVEVEHGGSVTAPTAPTVANYTFKTWDHGDWLGCVTNNVTCWALYEWTDKSKTPNSATNIDSQNLGTREQPYTLDELFKMYSNIAWTDEFSGTKVKDNFYGARSHTNGELCQKSNANRIVENGILKLRVKREKSGNYNFTSGEITTSGKVTFKKGRIEIRAKLNAVRGQWPSFWTMHTGWTSDYNEIDVFEQLSGSDWIGGTLHAGHGGIPRTSTSSRGVPEDGFTFSEGFHRIGAIVTEKELIWYVDDHIFKRLDLSNEPWSWTPNVAKYILLCSGLCAGGWLEGLGPELKCATEADVPADFQQEDYEIDYLRVYTNTQSGNTVSYAAAPAASKLSGPVRAAIWTGYNLSSDLGVYQSYGEGWTCANSYVRNAIGQFFEREKTDVVVFLRVPTDTDQEKKGSSDIPGVSAAFIDNPIMSTRKNSNNQNEAYETNEERRSGVFFDHERFAPGEANLGELDLGMGSTFTNLYAICADLKEKSTGARVKVVGVNVVATNGIENTSSNVSKAFNTLFSKLNSMKQNGDKVIVVFNSLNWSCYSYAKTLANNGIGAYYEYLGQNGNWPAYQHVYVSKNRQSASMAIPANLTVPKKNLTSSYSHKPATAVATVTFDEVPDAGDGYADEFAASDYSKALNITVNGYSGSALANFPVLVKLSTAISGFKYSDFRLPNGSDLRFVDGSGNLIPHEVDTWNTNGVSTVWVKVPSLEANARIIAFYGCATPVRPLAEKVWDGDYVGVWHLGESALPLRESSGNSTDFAYQAGTGVGFAAGGVVGGAVDFPASGKTNTLVALDHANLDGFTKFTIEAWTKQAAHKSTGGILSKRETYNREASYWFYDKDGKTMLRATTNGTSGVDCIYTIQPPVNQWNHQVYSVDTTTSSSNFKGYLNGAAAGSASKAFRKIFAGRGNLFLGNLNPDAADQSFNGQIDEVRISRCVRSAEWIKATYDTVTDANFLTYAMATTPYSSSYGQLNMSAFAKKVDVTFSGYSGSALANFPVLVRLSTAIQGFSYSDFRIPNGGDLRFADATGKLLPHEIDTWNPSGVSTVWVKVPSLKANTKITACYGCSEPPLVAAKDVWDDDYVGVWHLGESALPMKESSRTSTDFTSSNGTGIEFASAGIVGGSVDFGDSGKSRSLTALDHDALDGFQKCTIEAWTYIDSEARSFKKDGTDLNKGLLAKRISSTSQSSYYLFDTGSATSLNASSNGTSSVGLSSAVKAASDAWTHQAYTIDGSTASNNIEGWKNGVSAGRTSKFMPSINAGSANLVLGNLGATDTRNFPGKIDEVRISKVVRSGDWIKATHDTVATAGFATYAMNNEVTPPEPDRVLYVDVDGISTTNTLNAALVTSYITNIVKRGTGTLVASALPNYEGGFTLEGGVFKVGVKHGLGKHGYANSIYVGPNASLWFSGEEGGIFDNKKIVFEGAGASSAPSGAKFFNIHAKWVAIGSGMSFTFKTDTKFACGCWNRMILKNVDVDMQGHKLSLVCSPGNQVEFSGSRFRNPGRIVAEKSMQFVVASGLTTFDTPASGAGEIWLGENAAYNGSGKVSAADWTIVATSHTAKVVANTNRRPEDSANAMWNGKIVFGKRQNYFVNFAGGDTGTKVSNTVFNVKGPVSGSGKLLVGPGWLNLHTSANNTYSGDVTVTGMTPPGTPKVAYPVLAGGGGIGLWNGAACFPNASSITFTNTARLAFMDSTACSVPKVKFIALEGETMSISGGVHTARSTMAGITKTGAGTLVIDSPVSVTGLVDVTAGTLTVANRSSYITDPTSQEAVLAVLPQFASLKFASGTTFDLSENPGQMINDLEGSPVVTNAGLVGVAGKWTLDSPSDQLVVVNANATPDGGVGVLCFATGATFDLADEAAFRTAVQAAGPNGLMVAHAYWILNPEVEGQLEGMQGMITLPQPASTLGPGWSMVIGRGPGDDFDGRGLYLRYSDPSASGYAAWIKGKGLSGASAAADRVTMGIANVVRYAFNIDPATSEIGAPIIEIGPNQGGKLAVKLRELAEGRGDVTYGVLATESLDDWDNAKFVPYSEFTNGAITPAAIKNPAPAQMFFRYKIDIKQ